METATIWGWLLVMQLPGMPAIIDPNYTAKEWGKCEQVRVELVALHPEADIRCDPTWKPETAPKRKVVHKSRYRTARR